MFEKTSICIISVVSLCSRLAAMSTTPEPIDVLRLSENIPRCPEDNQINECIANAFNYMLRSTLGGVPELNIPSIDPFAINKLNVHFSNNLIRGKAALRHVQITGLSKSTVRKIQYQRKDKNVKLNVHFQLPLLELTGQYRAEVLLNNVKFSSKGQLNISMIDIDSKSEHFAELLERDGHTFMKLTKLNLDPTLGDMKIYASGLVPDPTLNAALLEIVNNNWRLIYRSVINSTRSTWEPIIVNYTNNFFSHLPFDLLITKPKE